MQERAGYRPEKPEFRFLPALTGGAMTEIEIRGGLKPGMADPEGANVQKALGLLGFTPIRYRGKSNNGSATN